VPVGLALILSGPYVLALGFTLPARVAAAIGGGMFI